MYDKLFGKKEFSPVLKLYLIKTFKNEVFPIFTKFSTLISNRSKCFEGF